MLLLLALSEACWQGPRGEDCLCPVLSPDLSLQTAILVKCPAFPHHGRVPTKFPRPMGGMTAICIEGWSDVVKSRAQ